MTETPQRKTDCVCTATSCPNHGYCGPCREQHKKSGTPTACQADTPPEETFDGG